MAAEDELLEVLSGLESLLLRAGLGFVVDQERALAVEGVAEPVSERTRQAEFLQTVRAAGGPSLAVKASDTGRRLLSTGERVAWLLDLVEVATAATVEIEARVREAVELALPTPDEEELVVRFTPPEEELLRGGTAETWELQSASMTAAKLEATRAVTDTLDRLRSVLNLQRGPWLRRIETTTGLRGRMQET